MYVYVTKYIWLGIICCFKQKSFSTTVLNTVPNNSVVDRQIKFLNYSYTIVNCREKGKITTYPLTQKPKKLFKDIFR